MHLNILTTVTTVLAVLQHSSAAAITPRSDEASIMIFNCYSSGRAWGASSQKDEARHAAKSFCNKNGDATYGNGSQVKECWNYSNGKIVFRIKNGFGSAKFLSKAACTDVLTQFINNCERGGYDDSVNGWRGRADPGEGCD